MGQNTNVIEELGIELPPSAPQVRVTAGVGSAGQKTWNLRRPVTLVGSRRPAHIVLHDHDISIAHCIIINTGNDVLLFDLHTSGGTYCNKDQVHLAGLKDGDVITVGETKMQIAITVPADESEDSGCGMEFVEPTRFRFPVTLSLIHADRQWTVEDAATLIGRHEKAGVRLDNQEVSTRHAVLFRFGKVAAVYDLGSKSGVWVNGQRCNGGVLADGDRVTVGPFGLGVCIPDRKGPAPAAKPASPAPKETASCAPVATATVGPPPSSLVAAPAKPQAATAPETAPPSPDATPSPPDLGPKVDPLQNNIADAWQRLNLWRSQLQQDANRLGERQSSIETREAELDARDAALRGQLHDITRFNELLAQRERDSLARGAQVQAEADALVVAKREAAERETDLQRRLDDVSRRENVLAQRWSRLQSTTCPHCRKPLNVGSTSAGESA